MHFVHFCAFCAFCAFCHLNSLDNLCRGSVVQHASAVIIGATFCVKLHCTAHAHVFFYLEFR